MTRKRTNAEEMLQEQAARIAALSITLQESDMEILVLRKVLVRIRNIASGSDPNCDASDIIELCNTAMGATGRVLGREV